MPNSRRHRRVVGLPLAAAALLFPVTVEAHSSANLAGGFVAGFEHPLTGFDHLLAMVAVGLWGAFLGRPLIVALPVIFPTVMTLGALLAILGLPLPPVELGIALSVLALGLAIAGAVRAPVWAAALIVGTFAIFHGYAHGKEIPSLADPVAYSLGFVLATGLLHVTGITLGLLNTRPGGAVATRSLGGLIAACGAYFLWRALAG